MFFFQVEFEDGKSHEIKAPDERHAVAWGRDKMRRWNQPSAKIFRTSPAKPDFRKHLDSLQNEDFKEDQPILTKDPQYLSRPIEKKSKKKSKASGGGSKKEAKVTHAVPLKDVAEKLGTDAGAIRRKLRSAKVEKPSGGWGWDSWEDPMVIQIMEWYKKD